MAADIAARAVTLLRDRDGLVPAPAGGRTVLVQYMPETELRAGRTFAAAVRQGLPRTPTFKIGPAVSAAMLDSIARVAHGADRVIVATYVRRIEGEGRFAIPAPIAAWIDTLSTREKVVVVSLGNPYLIRQFPAVGTYLVTYGVADVLERAAAQRRAGPVADHGEDPGVAAGILRARGRNADPRAIGFVVEPGDGTSRSPRSGSRNPRAVFAVRRCPFGVSRRYDVIR